VIPDAEIIALIAYLQRLGKDIKAEKTAEIQK
jgi:cbb3-type cytochrome oxidase cytochrome c subunit